VPKHTILVVFDVHVQTPAGEIGWAYWRRAKALWRHAPDDFEVEICQLKDLPYERSEEFDLIFNLEATCAVTDRIRHFSKDVPVVYSFNSGPLRKDALWPMVLRQADFVIINNRACYRHFNIHKRSCNISNGIDSEIWRPLVPIAERPHRILWTGSSNPKKGKGYFEVLKHLEPMARDAGFECDFAPVDQVAHGQTRTTDQMIEFYNSGSYILCASQSEGTPGSSLEGMACGCVLVTTKVGNAVEFGIDGENLIFSERDPQSFLDALIRAREDRERLSANGAELMRSKWSYGEPGHRAKWFFALFRRIIQDGAASLKPFSYIDKHWSEI
jgi:glycosyltransferase involved in cell wall biosynthesis